MNVRPASLSDEEIIKRLQIVMRGSPSNSKAQKDLVRLEGDVREIRTLAHDLALRACAEQDRWGIASAPADLRDDAAADALVSLLAAVGSFRGQQAVAAWFATEVQGAIEQLQELQGAHPEVAKEREPLTALPTVFSNALWGRFEQEFPREAFALRLRYLLNRDMEEMASMLGASTPHAVTMRLNRARDRFERFCRQQRADARETEQMLRELGEVRVR